MLMNERKVMYTPNGPIYEGSVGAFSVIRRMFSEAILTHELIWQLFLRDFNSRYRQSLLGVAWAVLLPLVTVGMFIVMNRSGIVTIGRVGVPYPVYALVGLSIWHLFSTGVSACSTALINAGSMVTKINFPKSALIFAAAGQGVVEFLVRAILTAVVFAWYGVVPNWGDLLIGLLLLLPVGMMMLGAGFILSLIAVLFRDVVNALNILLLGLMLLTPILYPISGDSPLGGINAWNPLNYLVNVPRDLILHGYIRDAPQFAFVSLLSLMVFLVAWRLFYLAQAKIAERI